MSGPDQLVLLDTPSIKRYVFGTDTLREIRGASALLDQLNRIDTERQLQQALPEGAGLEKVYANGGTAQFLLHNCEAEQAREACRAVVRRFMEATAGDVQPVFGVAALGAGRPYRSAVNDAFLELRSQRELSTIHRSAQLMPLVAECASASHLPASKLVPIGGDSPRRLSRSSHNKEVRGRSARKAGVWSAWMRHLASGGPWPAEEDAEQGWDALRCSNISDIGESSRKAGHIGLVYADGNAMGRVVQQLDSPEKCRVFSETVDRSIRHACFAALESACAAEIEKTRRAAEAGGGLRPLPADILLLGGDDLLVVVPADRAIDFAAVAANEFERLTAERLAGLSADESRDFFQKQVGQQGFTISCGVAIARSSYPFYLLLDLAEDLLANAKRRGTMVVPTDAPTAPPAHIDFHVVAGANSLRLEQFRSEDYHTDSDFPRTLRPLSLAQLGLLRSSIANLRSVNFPRSKLHALLEAALLESDVQAERAIRDIWGRCKASDHRNERQALWGAVESLRPGEARFDFPWFISNGKRTLALADIVEAFDLFKEL